MLKLNKYIKRLVAVFLVSLSAYALSESADSLALLAQQSIANKAFPGFCIQVGDRKAVLLDKCYGAFSYKNKYHDSIHSSFDIASLTKILATTSDIMRLYDQGKIDLNDKAAKYLPTHSNITIRELLDHSSGLPAEVVLPTNWNYVLHIKPNHTPGTHYRYSDINFLWLQKIIEKISNQPFDQYTQQQVFQPLEMKHSEFNPLKIALNASTVPTLTDGIVDDPLAQNFSGVAGNAGVFTTINDLGCFARVLLNHGKYNNKQWLKASTIKHFSQRDLIVKNSTRALGFDTVYNPLLTHPQPHQFSAGQYINPNAFGHTGYTGTALWVSPKDNLYMVFLSNRVNRVNQHMQRHDKYWRQRIANWVWQHYGHLHKNQTYTEPKIIKRY
ncbi:MAG: serine hydrolase [Coxiellaceae bacterium]|nr:serine hydrolase [Coxiellaceae bacterium]